MNFKGFIHENVAKMRQKRHFSSKSLVRHQRPPLSGRQRRQQDPTHANPFEADQPQTRIFNDTRRIPRLVPLESHAQARFLRALTADAGFEAHRAHVMELLGADGSLYFGQQLVF